MKHGGIRTIKIYLERRSTGERKIKYGLQARNRHGVWKNLGEGDKPFIFDLLYDACAALYIISGLDAIDDQKIRLDANLKEEEE